MRRLHLDRPALIGVVAGTVVLAGAGIAVASGRDGTGDYRIATATVSDVDSTLSLSGTIAASSRRDLTFGTDGEVEKVSVEVGDDVSSGDTVATLDPEDLDAAVTRAEATLATAKAQLVTHQSAQSSTVSAAASASTRSTASKGGSMTRPSDGSVELQKTLDRLRTQQEAVTTTQSATTEAITAAKAAVAARSGACSTSAVEDGTDQAAANDACAAALSAAQDAQDLVADRQDSLQQAIAELTTTLTGAVGAFATSAAGGASASAGEASTPSAASSTSGSPATDPTSGGGGTVSAATLAKDQAAIDTAAAALTEAERAREAGTLTAPFDGTVLDVSVGRGDVVSSSDVAVVLVGDGGSTVTTTVTVDQVDQVQKGQRAEILPAGFDEPVDGTVTAIGLLPTTGDGATTYPVTIDLADDVAAPEGAGAAITLVTGTVEDAVAVPSSAVTVSGDRATVTVLADGEPTRTTVTVGVVGSRLTAISEGLTEGQEVVLADLDAALPTGQDVDQRTFTSGRMGPGAGFGGGAAGGGGPPGR